MSCEFVALPTGGHAIICGTRRKDRCTVCGRAANRLCDWKVPERRSGTCDTPVCRQHTHQPAPDKDLCPTHAREWHARCNSTKERKDHD